MTRLRIPALISLLSLLTGGPALAADPGFAPVPSPEAGAKNTAVKLKVVGYGGNTNGEMIVEVVNDTRKPSKFEPKGLYFVPQGDPETAPQRLGAAGPFEVAEGDGWKNSEALTLKPGERKKVKLQVFCIDSHRSSPNPSTPFALASDRMPKELAVEVYSGTDAILKANKVTNAKHAKSAVQSHMWQTRDKKWVKLQGERKNEKSSSKGVIRQELNAPNSMQIQRRAP